MPDDLCRVLAAPSKVRFGTGSLVVVWSHLHACECDGESWRTACSGGAWQGAGFYVDATESPWAPHFKMRSYILDELRALIVKEFPQIDLDRSGISGHSMGGHGALTLALTNPDKFKSVSAFSPICNPHGSDWGRKQLGAYLGDEANWGETDASKLVTDRGWQGEILVDQGDADNFLELLKTQSLIDACEAKGQKATITMRPGYDHSYYFVSTYMPDHVAFHAGNLS